MSSLLIRSSAIRLGIFISALVIILIICFQLSWLLKVYRFEQKEFDHSVIKVIRGLYEDLEISNYNTAHLNELVEKPESHLYLANITLPVNTDSLTSYLQDELENFGIFTNCLVGIYSRSAGKYIFSDVLTSAGVNEKTKTGLPSPERKFDYLALYFPNRQQYILSQMNFWIISSAVLLIILLLLSAGIYYFYRQKFLNEIQKDFIHSFAHEFKTPVSVISLAADVLAGKSIIEKPAKLSTYAGIVKDQANYLQNQIEKLLQFAYTESRQLHLKTETVNVHNIITEAAGNLSPLIIEKNAELKYLLNANGPVVLADRDYLLIVITNLLDNALKYSRNPNVIISTSNIPGSLIVSINDNGIGIEKKEIKKLFRKFYRVQKGDAYPAKGFGLGLSFVKKILDAHRAKIKVESNPGHGSTFIVMLPQN